MRSKLITETEQKARLSIIAAEEKRRVERVQLAVNLEEKIGLANAAKSRGMNLSEFVRYAVRQAAADTATA